MNGNTPAKIEYEAAVEDLIQFCETYTGLKPIIRDEEYPFSVQFVPEEQLSMFGNVNVDENGEVNDMTITCGLSTSVKSTLIFEMDSTLLKKLIKLAEKCGYLYYHAFREGYIEYGKTDKDEAFEEACERLRELCERREADDGNV